MAQNKNWHWCNENKYGMSAVIPTLVAITLNGKTLSNALEEQRLAGWISTSAATTWYSYTRVLQKVCAKCILGKNMHSKNVSYHNEPVLNCGNMSE